MVSNKKKLIYICEILVDKKNQDKQLDKLKNEILSDLDKFEDLKEEHEDLKEQFELLKDKYNKLKEQLKENE